MFVSKKELAQALQTIEVDMGSGNNWTSSHPGGRLRRTRTSSSHSVSHKEFNQVSEMRDINVNGATGRKNALEWDEEVLFVGDVM